MNYNIKRVDILLEKWSIIQRCVLLAVYKKTLSMPRHCFFKKGVLYTKVLIVDLFLDSIYLF